MHHEPPTAARALARQVAEAWIEPREAAGFPLLKGKTEGAE